MQTICSLCDAELDHPENFTAYPNVVCRECEKKAVNSDGLPARHDTIWDYGDNPVFIDGVKCWRRYKFGGYLTMWDAYDCSTLEEFYMKNKPIK